VQAEAAEPLLFVDVDDASLAGVTDGSSTPLGATGLSAASKGPTGNGRWRRRRRRWLISR